MSKSWYRPSHPRPCHPALRAVHQVAARAALADQPVKKQAGRLADFMDET